MHREAKILCKNQRLAAAHGLDPSWGFPHASGFAGGR